MFPRPFTPSELLAIAERLTPAKLFMRTAPEKVESEVQDQLHAIIFRHAVDPKQRMENIEYLLLLMHRAMSPDPKAYLMQVFLPWVALRSRIATSRERLGLEFVRMAEFDDDPQKGTLHAAVSIYRPMVADILDPYLTLLVATYQVIDGSFTSIEASNLGSGERSKAEMVESRIRKAGGPDRLLAGYDPLVRNALSHIGSEGVRVETDSIVFRNIKRTSPPVVETRRWSHDELYTRTMSMMEFISSIDAVVEVFGVDCSELLAEDATLRGGMMEYALTPERRAMMRAKSQATLEEIRTDPDRTLQLKVQALERFFRDQLGVNHMEPAELSFQDDPRVLACTVSTLPPIEATDDIQLRGRAMVLIRFLIEARRTFGGLFDKIIAVERNNDRVLRSVFLPVASLDDYIAEEAGLVDLVQEAEITQDGAVLGIVLDEKQIRAAEDASLGPLYPRRGRPRALS